MNEQLERDGWVLVDLPRPEAVTRIVDILRAAVNPIGWRPISDLAYYRTADDDLHERTQARLTTLLNDAGLLSDLVRAQSDLLDALVGPGYLVQRAPHLRITRPRVERDNVGYHRDTDYGAQPEELSVWIPFVDLPASGSLEVADGSHRLRLEAIEHLEEGVTGVTRGSTRHALGFPYAPKVLPPEALVGLHGVPIRRGQALVFSLALVHGTTNNRSSVTRFSADIRVAPAAFAERARPDYYLEA